MNEEFFIDCHDCGACIEIDNAQFGYKDRLLCPKCFDEAEYAEQEMARIADERVIDARLEWRALSEPMLGAC